ncbi:MAG: hypothetical protein J0H23_11590 [Micrococcales bacterium]|nr:hypothetical protein [Micrococcales bacterium]OJX69399.1 MAG: hypothetical protein BGO94_12825 [Micrococcales bacterium 72-143]
MIGFLLTASIAVNSVLQRVGPSNIVQRWVRQRRNLKWGIPVAIAGTAVYGTAVYWCGTLLQEPDFGWLSILFFVLVWSLFKFMVFGPISVILLLVARIREAHTLAATIRQLAAEDRAAGLDPLVVPRTERRELLASMRR